MREFIYPHRKKNYRVQVSPDIACRGGEKGKGTTVSAWELDQEGNVIPGLRCFQGPFSDAAIKRLIKCFERTVGAK